MVIVSKGGGRARLNYLVGLLEKTLSFKLVLVILLHLPILFLNKYFFYIVN